MVENVKLPDGSGVVNDVGKSQGFIGISIQYGMEMLTVTAEGEGGELTEVAVNTVEAHWKFSDEELSRLLMGAPLIVHLLTTRWPPSRITVGEIPG